MANSQSKKTKEEKASTSTVTKSVSQTNCQGIRISRTVSIKCTCKNSNAINDSQVTEVKSKKGKWSKFRRNVSSMLKKNKAEKHSTTVKSQSLKEVLKIEENGEKKKSEEAVSKIVAVNGVKMRRMRSIKMKEREGKSETEEENQELCKKRILMGGKCKPLNESGVLHYDQNGIFLPEDVP
ncbi:hypothetical protein POM88_001341 [Heracleum sosnowskyi]|uniref:Uncharacterized protein n=1 Tax=Heracleum sosnowskyi TaxID=360622 RepID=A0AAD8JDI3_9APIA|nr:hypothetical protein POM88_001341 [Heracleum sosnowskyi]